MKQILIILISMTLYLNAKSQTSSFYQIGFQGLDRDRVNMNEFKGKKIIVAEFDAKNPDKKQLLFLDSLYKIKKSKLEVIAIPVTGFGATTNEREIKKLWRDTLKLSFIVTKLSKAKKSESEQHILLVWLSKKNQNNHFDEDILKSGQMFIINETGRLYAHLNDGQEALKGNLMNTLLEQKIQEN